MLLASHRFSTSVHTSQAAQTNIYLEGIKVCRGVAADPCIPQDQKIGCQHLCQ